jgi:hypothetical protein
MDCMSSLLLYCFKCKSKTDSDNTNRVKTSNGRWRIISNCCICGCKKSSFVKETVRVEAKPDHVRVEAKPLENTVRVEAKLLGGGDLIDYLGEKFGEIHLPGHNFTGPGTKLAERLERGDKPVNQVDALAKEHDIAYRDSKDKPNKKEMRRKADKEMLKKLDELENLTIGERIEKRIVKPVLKTKLFLGLGLEDASSGETRVKPSRPTKCTTSRTLESTGGLRGKAETKSS